MRSQFTVTMGLMVIMVFMPSNGMSDCFQARETDSKSTATPKKARTIGWFDIILQIAAAPKIIFKVDKLEVYRNGVLADFTITNKTSKRVFFDTAILTEPVEYMELLDDKDRQWEVPHFRGDVDRFPPDTFVMLESGQTIEYRSKLSLATKPLRLVDQSKPLPKIKPTELKYRIAVWWGGVYSQLTEDSMKRLKAIALGTGKVETKWSAEEYPKDWQILRRR